MSRFTKLMDDFAQFELAKPSMGIYPDPIVPLGAVFSLNAYLEEISGKISEAYTNKEALEDFYLDFLPTESIAFPEDVFAIHEMILDMYQFLYIQDHLSRKKYQEMLEFFQENKDFFIEKMGDDRYWSKDKIKEMEELSDMSDEDILNDPELLENPLFRELADIYGKLMDSFQPPFAEDSQKKVVPFPAKQTNLDSLIYQLRIDIKGFKPPIWRRVLVPANSTFADLHQVIQRLFEWEDSHLHSFEVSGFLIEPAAQFDIDFELFYDEEPMNSEDIHLKEILYENCSFTYTYDFGDDWEHKIKLEKIFSLEEFAEEFSQYSADSLPVCIKGKGDAPMEDSRFGEAFIPFDLDEINARFK